MAQNDTNDTIAGGNTKTPAKAIRARGWCFTINNPHPKTNDTFDTVISTFEKIPSSKWIVGLEKGEQGTQHLQGFIKFKNARTFKSVKKLLPRAHLEKSKGSLKDNYIYCSKDGNFKSNFDIISFQEKIMQKILNEEYKSIEWKPWQRKTLDIIESKPDKRKIYWFWENDGNVGKSYLCKYICLTRDVIICDGKRSDIFNQIKMKMDEKKVPEIIICDVPRSSLNYINYGTLEKVKDGCIYSGKYEGGLCIYPAPHVIIFANEPPVTDELSVDRWEIVNI